MRVLKCGVTIETHYGPWHGGCLASMPESPAEWRKAIAAFAGKVAVAMTAIPSDDVLSVAVELVGSTCNAGDYHEWAMAAQEFQGLLFGDLDLLFTPLICEKGKVNRGKRA